jgi:uncharacterized protein
LDFLFDGPEDAPTTIVLAHGAGAAMDTPFMAFFAEGLAAWGFRVARFEFPYMAERRISGKKAGPNRPIVLLETWQNAIDALGGPDRLVIGGKSMGGRIASMIADEAGVRGLLCLGYPFHPPGKPEKRRVEHLQSLTTPALFVQGTRDPLGARNEVQTYTMSTAIRLHWLEDGDHGFKPRKMSGRTEGLNLSEGLEAAVNFVSSLGTS